MSVFLNIYEKFASKRLRQWAVDESWEQLKMEDENTFYGNLASVGFVCVVSVFFLWASHVDTGLTP